MYGSREGPLHISVLRELPFFQPATLPFFYTSILPYCAEMHVQTQRLRMRPPGVYATVVSGPLSCEDLITQYFYLLHNTFSRDTNIGS